MTLPSAPIRIRDTTIDDSPAVAAITRAAFAKTAELGLPSSVLGERLRDVRNFLEAHRVLVAEHDGRLAGCVRVEQTPRRISFSRLAVLPVLQGYGIGTALVAHVESLGAREEYTEIYCAARSERPDNRPFYLQLNYVVVGTEDVYGVQGLRTLLRKSLIT